MSRVARVAGRGRAVALLAAVLLALNAPLALAWGTPGHRAVGAIADRLLAGSRAAQRVEELLGPGASLEAVSTWADCVKGGCGPQTAEMDDFARANPGHAGYHYTDVPFQAREYVSGGTGTRADDVVQVLAQAIAVLRGDDVPASNPRRFTARQALLLVAHLTGDVHQPLHVGAAYLDAGGRFVVPASDAAVDEVRVFDTRGGNALRLDGRNFHAYWDFQAVEYAIRRSDARTPREFADRLLESAREPARAAGDPAQWPREWASETLAAAREAYGGLAPGERLRATDRRGEERFEWSVAAPADYARTSSATARERIATAGFRLASLLKAIWP